MFIIIPVVIISELLRLALLNVLQIIREVFLPDYRFIKVNFILRKPFWLFAL